MVTPITNNPSVGGLNDAGTTNKVNSGSYPTLKPGASKPPILPNPTENLELSVAQLGRKLLKQSAAHPAQIDAVKASLNELVKEGVLDTRDIKELEKVQGFFARVLVGELNGGPNAKLRSDKPNDQQQALIRKALLAVVVKDLKSGKTMEESVARIGPLRGQLEKQHSFIDTETGKVQQFRTCELLDAKSSTLPSHLSDHHRLATDQRFDPARLRKALSDIDRRDQVYQKLANNLAKDTQNALVETMQGLVDEGVCDLEDLDRALDQLDWSHIEHLLVGSGAGRSSRLNTNEQKLMRQTLLAFAVRDLKKGVHPNTVMNNADMLRSRLAQKYSSYDKDTGEVTEFRGLALLDANAKKDLPQVLPSKDLKLQESGFRGELFRGLDALKDRELPKDYAMALAATRKELTEKGALSKDQFDLLAKNLSAQGLKALLSPMVSRFGSSQSKKWVRQAMMVSIARDLEQGFGVRDAWNRANELKERLNMDYKSFDAKGNTKSIKGWQLLNENSMISLPEFRRDANMPASDRFNRDRLVAGLNDLQIMTQLQSHESHGAKTYLSIRDQLDPTEKNALFLYSKDVKNVLTIKKWNSRSRYGMIGDAEQREQARDVGLLVLAKNLAKAKDKITGLRAVPERNSHAEFLRFKDQNQHLVNNILEEPEELECGDGKRSPFAAADEAKQKLVAAAGDDTFDKVLAKIRTDYGYKVPGKTKDRADPHHVTPGGNLENPEELYPDLYGQKLNSGDPQAKITPSAPIDDEHGPNKGEGDHQVTPGGDLEDPGKQYPDLYSNKQYSGDQQPKIIPSAPEYDENGPYAVDDFSDEERQHYQRGFAQENKRIAEDQAKLDDLYNLPDPENAKVTNKTKSRSRQVLVDSVPDDELTSVPWAIRPKDSENKSKPAPHSAAGDPLNPSKNGLPSMQGGAPNAALSKGQGTAASSAAGMALIGQQAYSQLIIGRNAFHEKIRPTLRDNPKDDLVQSRQLVEQGRRHVDNILNELVSRDRLTPQRAAKIVRQVNELNVFINSLSFKSPENTHLFQQLGQSLQVINNRMGDLTKNDSSAPNRTDPSQPPPSPSASSPLSRSRPMAFAPNAAVKLTRKDRDALWGAHEFFHKYDRYETADRVFGQIENLSKPTVSIDDYQNTLNLKSDIDEVLKQSNNPFVDRVLYPLSTALDNLADQMSQNLHPSGQAKPASADPWKDLEAEHSANAKPQGLPESVTAFKPAHIERQDWETLIDAHDAVANSQHETDIAVRLRQLITALADRNPNSPQLPNFAYDVEANVRALSERVDQLLDSKDGPTLDQEQRHVLAGLPEALDNMMLQNAEPLLDDDGIRNNGSRIEDAEIDDIENAELPDP